VTTLDTAAGVAVASVDSRRSTIRRVLALVAVTAALAVPHLTTNQFHLHMANLALLNAIFAMSLGLIAWIGQLSLGHAAFAALGAYISALGVLRLGIPPLLGILLAGAVAGTLAAALGRVILRLRGVYFVLVTFLVGQMCGLVALNWESVTHGANGLVGIPAISVLGYRLTSRYQFYYFALVAFLAVLVLLRALMRSQYGRAFRAIAENIQLAESSGIDTSRFQVIAFALGSGIAGSAGAATAHYIRYISPDTFTFQDSVAYITMLVVGGRQTLAGAVLGAAFLTPLPEMLRGLAGVQHIIYGAILLAVLLFLPGGLSSIGSLLSRHRRRARVGRQP
jgi:branched-chain amino acid transport system permease protein